MKEEYNILKIEQPHFKTIMVEMCNRVGAKPELVNTKKEGWFKEYSWTDEEEESFKKWFVDYLYKNKEAVKELYEDNYRVTKKELKIRATWFLFNYGWSLKEEK